MVFRFIRAAQHWVSPPVLGFLLTPSLPRNLRIRAPQRSIVGAHRNSYIDRRLRSRPLSRDVVMEPRRRPFVRRIIEHLPIGNAGKRSAAVNRQWLPRFQAVLQLIWKNLRIARGLENFLRYLARYLMLPVPIGNAAYETARHDLRP